jgi:hypothetical protein
MTKRPEHAHVATAGAAAAAAGLSVLFVDRYRHMHLMFQEISAAQIFPIAVTAAVSACAGLALLTYLMSRWWRVPFTESFLNLRWVFWPPGLLVFILWQRPFLRPIPPLLAEVSAALTLITLIATIHRHPPPVHTRMRLYAWLDKHRYLLLSILILAIGTAWFAGAFGPRRKPVGDEPSYLMITHSISSDFDVVMDNDYAARHYRRFFSGEYPMFTHLGYDGKNYPHHSIGLPLLLAPVYTFARLGNDAWLVFSMRFTMLMMYILLALAVLHLIESFGIRRGIAFWTTSAGMLSGPMLFYSGELYPEIPAALIFVLAVTFLGHRGDQNRLLQWLLTGAGIAFLPWLGIKYIAAGLTLLIIALICVSQETSRWRKSLALLAVPVLSVAAYILFLFIIYRNINPGVIYTGVHPGTSQQALHPDILPFLSMLPSRLFDMVFFTWGFFLEQRIGLFFLFPAILFMFHGIPAMLRHRRRPSLVLLTTVAAHYGIYAWHNNWGGYCPPNRQAVSVIPLLLVPLAFGFSMATEKWPKHIAVFSTLIGWRFTLTLLHNERWLYTTMNPHLTGGGAQWLYRWSPLDSDSLPELFPLLMGPEKRWIPSIIWTIIFVLLIIIIRPSVSRKRHHAGADTGHVCRTAAILYLSIACTGLLIAALVPPHALLTKSLEGPVEKIHSIDGSIAGNSGDGFWITGGTGGRMLVSAPSPAGSLKLRIYSLTHNRIRIVTGRTKRVVDLLPYQPVYENITIGPWKRWADTRTAVLSIHVETGARPSDIDHKSKDNRFLGAYVAFIPE